MKTLIQQGAEAKIFLDKKENLIVKDRISKSYRLKELDEKIRKQRTKSEKKLLEKACKLIAAPNPLPLKEFSIIEMPFIKGKKLSESLDSFPLEKQKEILEKIGESVAKLHDADIIHGDLTTSNMILTKEVIRHDSNSKESLIKRNLGSLYFIDFGLGFISQKIEDRAVDVHLLKQALEARHFNHWQTLFNHFLKGYENSKTHEKALERLKMVEKRGRYKKGE
jgi:TP53 regulating kinase-like protein